MRLLALLELVVFYFFFAKEMINIAIKLATSITYTADGSQTNFSVPFDYLRPSFVHVSINDAEVSEGFTISNRMIIFDSAPSKDSIVHIYRNTPTTRLVSWADASVLKAADMTIQQVQQLHILEEASDWSKTNSIVLDEERGVWQGRNYRIANIADPVDAQDAVTKNYIDNEENSMMQSMNAIKTQTEQLMNTAGNHKDNAYNSAQSASASASAAEESARLAESYKNVAETAKSDASLYANSAKTSANSANTSKEAAQTAANNASSSASAAHGYRNDAKTYMDTASNHKDNAFDSAMAAKKFTVSAAESASAAQGYMDNAKYYSENVNVFTPSVSSDGVLSWTNKAGLANPPSVNIRGEKGAQGIQGLAGNAATITIGNVTTSAPGTPATVTNRGTSSAAVLDFTLPKGKDGADGGVTVDDTLSATSTNPVQNWVIKKALDDKTNKTDKIYEANLKWGGRNITDGYSPIDAAMISELGANRFMFGKAKGIKIEYSRDAGETWIDYAASDAVKASLFSDGNILKAGGEGSHPPAVTDMLRVTIDSDAFGVYTVLNKFALHVSTYGSQGCYCTIDAALEASPTVFEVFADKVGLIGRPGYNIINTRELITYGSRSSQNWQYGIIRFTFGCTGDSAAYKGLAILKILGFGGIGWNTPSNMAKDGHLYSYDYQQNATFPAGVTASNFVGKINGFSVGASVPADAKFTDTIYTHPATHPASMITGLDAYAKMSETNTWSAQQSFKQVLLGAERYLSPVVSGSSNTPQMSVMHYIATGAFTLNLSKIAASLEVRNSTVFTAYIESSADYSLTITDAGTLKYIGSASDVAITSAGLLLNILMTRDTNDNVTSIVQASKLS